MSKADLLKEIVAAYQKYGWTLRRVLFTENARRGIGGDVLQELATKGVITENAAVDALWFSRVAGEREAWELRAWQNAPYALFESFDRSTPETAREKVRREMENKLASSRFQTPGSKLV